MKEMELREMHVLFINIGLILTGAIGTGMSYLRYHDKRASHLTILLSSLALIDIYTDVDLLARLDGLENPTLFNEFGLALLASLFANVIILLYVFHVESRRNAYFSQWQTMNFDAFVTVFCFACLDMQIISITYSRVFGWSLTDAPLSREARRHLNAVSYLSLLFENIPQLIVQLKVLKIIGQSSEARSLFGDTLYFALILSIFDIFAGTSG